jgi:phosphatidylglycerophosphate synthase
MALRVVHAATPNGLTLLRALAAAATDLADGALARRLAVASRAGGHADAGADFLVLGAVFAGFVDRGMYPLWVLATMALMFAQFVATSTLAARHQRNGRSAQPAYDPVGRYYGATPYVAALAMFGADAAATATVPGLLLAVTVASLAGRVAWLARRRNWRAHAAIERGAIRGVRTDQEGAWRMGGSAEPRGLLGGARWLLLGRRVAARAGWAPGRRGTQHRP